MIFTGVKSIARLYFVFMCCAGSVAALAWNATGHRQVAAIAWHVMTPEARARAILLLRRHPDYPRWERRVRERDVGYGVFLEASVWADNIRHDPRFVARDDSLSRYPLWPGFPDRLRHGDWHYQDQESGQLLRRLPELARLIVMGSEAEQTFALPWILHLVGDAHQPLHLGGRRDRGGNQTKVERSISSRRKVMLTLHQYWDQLPSRFGGGIPFLPPSRAGAGSESRAGDVLLWARESRELARYAYPPLIPGTPVRRLTFAFDSRAKAIARSRIVDAGVRLGEWLNQLL
ncbi:MAG: S1/P1 nuclease [Zoogloeaceae bacterium]|nr:S1/P1 nuclease [Zoogloeaceae bacterium]